MASTLNNNDDNAVLLCNKVAASLGIKHQCRPKRWFLKKNDKARHKLKYYLLHVERDAEYLQRALLFHPSLRRSTRRPINHRIQSVIGSDQFEIFDNLRTLF